MTSRGADYYKHTNAIVIDSDTVRIGGSFFKREYEAEKIVEEDAICNVVGYFDVICSKCKSHTKVFYDEEYINYCPYCGAKFKDE